MSRLDRFSQELRKKQIGNFVVSNIFNVRYLSGFSGSTGWLLISGDGARLVTDFRYKEQAEGEVYHGIEVAIDKRDALAAICDMISDLDGKLGFEAGSLTYASYEKLKSRLRGQLVPIDGLIESLRKVKDESEIASISKAVEIADAVFAEIVGEIRPGLTEVDVAARIDFLLRKRSTEVSAFRTIVASGEHSSLPHATPTTRVIQDGDLVKMDFGAIWDGYCSDMTRTVVVGKASKEVKEIYRIVVEAQEKAIGAIRAGVSCSEADKAARDHIQQKGYGDKFGHGLGHGVGLEVHEGPKLSQKTDDLLESGMVVTVEPGVYIPGWGGVRVEDVVVVEDGGCKVLTASTKELLELGVQE